MLKDESAISIVPGTGIWDLNIGEITGHNIETQGRAEVNKMLTEGWLLLHVYTLKYREDGVWRERPMAILGKPRNGNNRRRMKPGVKLAAM